MAAAMIGAARGQTQIDLRTQGKNIDFSSAARTRPSKTGTLVPAVCTIGETFVKTDAATGKNLYICTATDVWSVQGVEIPDPTGRANQILTNDGSGLSWQGLSGDLSGRPGALTVTGGKLKVHRVVCAVDCGRVVNPAILEQQIQSGIAFGLAAALKGGITLDRGRVQQSNFHQYDVLRIDEMPVVEVHIVDSQNASGGAGEASTPGIAPAVCNAVFKATGKRIRRLPIRKEDLA